MKPLKAADVMVTPVVSTHRNASARNVALHLLSGLYSGMPVVDEESKVVGIITEIDLLDAILAEKDLENTTAEELMTKEANTVDIDTPVSEIMATMKEKSIIRLPVTRAGKLVGIVARRDVLRSFVPPLQIVVL